MTVADWRCRVGGKLGAQNLRTTTCSGMAWARPQYMVCLFTSKCTCDTFRGPGDSRRLLEKVVVIANCQERGADLFAITPGVCCFWRTIHGGRRPSSGRKWLCGKALAPVRWWRRARFSRHERFGDGEILWSRRKPWPSKELEFRSNTPHFHRKWNETRPDWLVEQPLKSDAIAS